MKNLAFCLFDLSNNNYQISMWDVVNLCPTESFPCCMKQIKKKHESECPRNAVYTKNDKYYCKIHAKQCPFKPPIGQVQKIHKYTKKQLLLLCKSLDISTPNGANKVDVLKLVEDHIDKYYLNHIKQVQTADLNLITYGINLRDNFDLLFKDQQIDIVVIENQIATIASRMKTLQGMIAQYFIMKNIDQIFFVSAIYKLPTTTKKTTYSERKQLGIKITNEILSENDQLLESKLYFSKQKKRDDLADSFLQGLAYIKNNIFSSA